jgi:hypothetical protein
MEDQGPKPTLSRAKRRPTATRRVAAASKATSRKRPGPSESTQESATDISTAEDAMRAAESVMAAAEQGLASIEAGLTSPPFAEPQE